MDHLDTAKEKVADAIGHMENAISAALPGQAPAATQDDVRHAIRDTRVVIDGAIQALGQAEGHLQQLGHDDN